MIHILSRVKEIGMLGYYMRLAVRGLRRNPVLAVGRMSLAYIGVGAIIVMAISQLSVFFPGLRTVAYFSC